MVCFECGNCREEVRTYYCAAKDEILVKADLGIVEKERKSQWKKGDKDYESRRRKLRGGEEKIS